MKPKRRITTTKSLWTWLEGKFRETNLKLDHILFRLREEDPRIYQDEEEREKLHEYDEPGFPI
jgi:hypothetical protein